MVQLTSVGRDALDSIITKALQERNIPGFVFGASNQDEEIYFNSNGYRTVNDPTSGEVNPDSVLWLCSQTKFVVHVAALQLIEQGKFTQDTPVTNFFPQFANPVIVDNVQSILPNFKPAKTTILVKHLLNFSSGLFYPPPTAPNSSFPPCYCAPHNKDDPHAEFFRILKGDLPGLPLRFEPGTDFAYGFSADVVGFIVEKVSGKTLEQYCQENIFQPLGMRSSFYRTPELEKNMISLSFRRDGKLEPWSGQSELIEQDPSKGDDYRTMFASFSPTKPLTVFLFLGGVGLYSSLRDYLTFLRHILQLRAGKITNGILTPGTVHELFVPTLTQAGQKSVDLFTNAFPGGSWSVGLAVCTLDWPKRRKRGTAFWSGWAGTYFFIDPDTGVAVVFGTQIAPTRDPEVIKLFGELEEALYSGLAN